MVMDTLQIRLGRGLVKRVDGLVTTGVYANRSDVIRDAVRRFVWEKEAGSVTYRGPATKLVRNVRKDLSKHKMNLKEINSL